MTALDHANELDEEYPVGEAVVERFRADGFVKLAGVLSAAVIAEYEPEITRTLFEQNTQTLPLDNVRHTRKPSCR